MKAPKKYVKENQAVPAGWRRGYEPAQTSYSFEAMEKRTKEQKCSVHETLR